MTTGEALAGGFADPVFDAQAAFRAVLDAMAHPGRIVELAPLTTPPPPLGATAATLLRTLADEGTPVFLDSSLAADPAVSAWIGFHCGAPTTRDPAEAAFAVIGDPSTMPPFTDFALGSAEYPDRSTTLILQVARLDASGALQLTGPGIADLAFVGAEPLPPDFIGRMQRNRALFPRGVDLLLAGPAAVVGLPRSVTVTEPG